MTRTKRKARRRVALSTRGDSAEEDEASNAMESYEIKDQQQLLDSNDEIESFVEEFEEVDNVVSAVMQIDGDVQTPTGQTLAENSEFDNLDKSSADPSRSNREASEEESEPRSNGVCEERILMNDECPAAEVKNMELPNRCADDGVNAMDKEEGEGREMLEERTGDDRESDKNSKDGGVSEQPLTSVENQESQIDRRDKFSLQVKTVYVEGAPKSWNADKLREICEQFGEIKNVKISRNLNRKGKDFGFIAFTTREDALACVDGIKEREFQGDLKVKAYIARPLTREWFPKVNHGGFKRRHKPIAGLKITKIDRSEVSKSVNVSERQMQTVLLAHGVEEKTTSLSDKTGQYLPNLSGTRESETNKCERGIPLAAEVWIPSRRRKNRKRKNRKRGKDMTASKKQKGNSQEQTNVSSRKPRRKPRSRKKKQLAAVSIPIKPKPKGYVARQVHSPVHRSNMNVRPEMAPHARYIKIDEQRDPAGWVGPAFRHRQLHAVNTRPVVHKGSQPHTSYQKHFLGNDVLPHAGYIEPVGKQRFSNHTVRRHAGYNGLGNDGFAYTGRMW